MGKTTGIVRHIDHLGRIVVPKEMCRTLHIKAGDALEINLEGRKITVTKYEVGCTFCGSQDGTRTHEGKLICSKCLEALKNL